jgi:putative phage-type endonuclease
VTVERPSGRPIPLLVPGSAEWMARMSASKIAAVVGLSPYQSRYSLWMRMAGLVAQEEQSDAMSRGHYLEEPLAQWWADQHPELQVMKTGTFVHATEEWMIAAPDRLVVHPSGHVELLQCKTAADLEHWGDAGSDDVPVGYRAQVMWEMAVTGLSTCHFAVILPYLEFREYTVRFDQSEADYLMSEGRKLLDDLAAGQRPPIDEHKATYEVVRQLHPDIQDVKVDVPAELATAYVEAVAACKAAEDAKRQASALLVDHMGSAKAAYHDGRCIARRQVKAGGAPYLVAAKTANPTSVRSAA